MSLTTNLPGRLRNTTLPRSHALLPLFEVAVNSIHACEDVQNRPTLPKVLLLLISYESQRPLNKYITGEGAQKNLDQRRYPKS